MNLVDVCEQETMTQSSIIGKIVGVSVINQSYYCSVCAKKGRLEDSMFCCDSCSIKVGKHSVTCSWNLKLVVQDVVDKQQHMFFSNDIVHELAGILKFPLDDENSVASNFFNDHLDPVKLNFDIVSKSVMSVTAIA